MAYVKWVCIAAFWVIVLAFLHYTLPQTDIARVTDTYSQRVDPGANRWFWANADTGESTAAQGRDVFFIQSRLSGDDVMIYRNEDTGWGWPPFFKFDSANLQAEAADVRSTSAEPQWVAIRHYGWRNEMLTIYPNAISITPVSGPDARIIPWMNIIILTLLVAFVWAVYVRWRRFRRARIDPALDEVGDNISDAGGWLKGLFHKR
ncbi:DUF1523 family protein [Salipiger sp. 1_MG-2023]|uniref:DUF1523 family protein n=1 Tax=Salipiger sp. 1_MG-2023 TaxID=3062665 RepID=UPI0026E14E59|nr:DUF1523 family protein [Salipiger sp. 1_MG-2023]MDO6586312.1 DUF1523 family protein [Salipiger sp. 1_MG-2023]